jgi:hypothetical protein
VKRDFLSIKKNKSCTKINRKEKEKTNDETIQTKFKHVHKINKDAAVSKHKTQE